MENMENKELIRHILKIIEYLFNNGCDCTNTTIRTNGLITHFKCSYDLEEIDND